MTLAWLELHQTLPTNKKTLRLKKILKIKTPQAVGHLCMLWLWALDNAPDGDLSDFSADEIAEVAEWSGRNSGAFLQALMDAGFIDEDHSIHDWEEYAGRLINQRSQQRERSRMRKQKQRDKQRDEPTGHADGTRDIVRDGRDGEPEECDCHTDVTRDRCDKERDGHRDVTCDGRDKSVTVTRLQYSTVPNSTVPNPIVSSSSVVVADVNARPRTREDGGGPDGSDDRIENNRMKFLSGQLGRGVVKLTENQFDDLLKRLGDVDVFDFYISKLADFIIEKGAKVKNHYQTILKWYAEDCEVEHDST